MEHYGLIAKWEAKLRLYLDGEKDFIPEINTKEFIKKNLNELLFDCNLYYCGKENFKKFFKNICDDLINHAIARKKNLDGEHKGCSLGVAKELPGLDYYDNRRDRFLFDELTPYQGQFGLWNLEKND